MSIKLFAADNYSGTAGEINGPTPLTSISKFGVPEKTLSSIKVPAFYTVYLTYNGDGSGQRLTIKGPAEVPTLAALGWRDMVVGVIVARNEPTNDLKLDCCRGIKTGQQCGEYVQGGGTCGAAVEGICATADGLAVPFCQTWCRQNPAACDTASVGYCQTHAADPYCSCIVSPAGRVANPKCVDRNCINTGYLTSNMQQTPCPAMITCETNTYLTNSGVLMTAIPVTQNCGGAVQPDAQQGASPGAQPQPPVANPALAIDQLLPIFLIILCVAIAIMSAVLFFRGSAPQPLAT